MYIFPQLINLLIESIMDNFSENLNFTFFIIGMTLFVILSVIKFLSLRGLRKEKISPGEKTIIIWFPFAHSYEYLKKKIKKLR